MPDFEVARNSTAKLGRVDGELKVGRNAQIEAIDGKVVVTEGAYFEGSAEVNCSLECNKLRINHGFVKVNGDLTVQDELDIVQSIEVDGETKARNIEVEGRIYSNSITANEIRANGAVKVEANLEVSKSLEVTGKLRVPDSFKLHDITITGNAKIGGGQISGTTQIRGKLEAASKVGFEELFITGKAELAAGCTAKKISTNGKLDVVGDMSCDEMEVRGKNEIEGNCTSKKILVSGELEVSGSLAVSDVLESYGTTEVEGNVTGTKLRAAGKFEASQAIFTSDADIAGRIETERGLKAKTITIGSGSRCEGPIVAETVEVGKSQLNVGSWQAHWVGQDVQARMIGRATKVDDIYATNVHLGAYSSASKIFAENVEVEKGCIIDQITYTGQLKMPEKHTYVNHPPEKVEKLPPSPI